MDDNILDLDFLLEPVKPARRVVLLGVEYALFSADLMENFLTFVAMTERVGASLKTAEGSDSPVDIAASMESLRTELRSMIRVLVPDMPEALLREKFPKLDQLQKLFTLLTIEVTENLPASVKKNLETEASGPAPAGI